MTLEIFLSYFDGHVEYRVGGTWERTKVTCQVFSNLIGYFKVLRFWRFPRTSRGASQTEELDDIEICFLRNICLFCPQFLRLSVDGYIEKSLV